MLYDADPRTASWEPWPEAVKVIISLVFVSKSNPHLLLFHLFFAFFFATNLMKDPSRWL